MLFPAEFQNHQYDISYFKICAMDFEKNHQKSKQMVFCEEINLNSAKRLIQQMPLWF